jgi:starvation-inducible DNA-binding protein
MLGELTVDNASVARSLEEAHELCEQQRDVATASLIEGWIDEAQNRVWFLREANRASGEL